MIFEKLSEQYSEAIYKISKEQPFLELIKSLTEINETFNSHLQAIISKAGSPNEANNKINSVHSQVISETNKAVRAARTSTVIVSAERIRQLLDNSLSTSFLSASHAINQFIKAFDEYIHNCNMGTCIELSTSGTNFSLALRQLKAVNEALEPAQKNKSLPSIKVYISGSTDLEEFSAKLQSLTKIIEICCNLLNMSMAEAAVAVGRIESGSFFARVSANPLVVAVVTIILSQGSEYLFSKTTGSSEHSEIRENSETLTNVLRIREILSANGFPTEKMDPEIKSSAVNLAKQLSKLIGNSQTIEINNETFSPPQTRLLAKPDINPQDKSHGDE